MARYDRYTLSPITPDDYPALANISILACMRNPLHYMTYPPNVSHEAIVQYTLESKIKFDEEGAEVQTIKVVDNQTPDKQIVGFAIWFMGPRRRNREPHRPERANFTFFDDVRRKLSPLRKRVYDDEKDIELALMRVLPSYQRKGIGGSLLAWGLQKASPQRKKVYLSSSPEASGLYLRHGFEVEGEVRMDLGEYGGDGVYVQSVMVWHGD